MIFSPAYMLESPALKPNQTNLYGYGPGSGIFKPGPLDEYLCWDENQGTGWLFRPHPGQGRELAAWVKITLCSTALREK